MRLDAKLGLVVLVLVIGISAALMFRKPSPIGSAAAQPPQGGISYDASAEQQGELVSPGPSDGGSEASEKRSMLTAEKLSPKLPARRDESVDAPRQPPTLPPSYVKQSEAPPPLPRTPVPQNNERPQAKPPQRSHKIVDGDSLKQLAERFLGNADRYKEIFDLNRELLRSEDLLPIGVVLKIPPRQRPQSAPPQSTALQSQTTPSQPTSLPQGSSKLVPIPPDAFGSRVSPTSGRGSNSDDQGRR